MPNLNQGCPFTQPIGTMKGPLARLGWRQTRAWRVWAFLLCLGLSLSSRGALQFDVFLGYDGVVREASWFPVICEVANDGPTFQAVFELSNSYYDSGSTRWLKAELPTNTRKRFLLPAFAQARYGVWNCRLLDQRGKVRAEQPGLRPQKDASAQIFLLGAVPRSFGGLPVFPDARISDAQPLVCHLRPELFPDNPITLEGLNALYVNSETALQLKAAQVNALTAWVDCGGHLMIGVEQLADINGTPWLRDLMPCDLSGMTPVTAQDELLQWLRGDRPGSSQEAVTPLEPARKTPPNQNPRATPEMARRSGLDSGGAANPPGSSPANPWVNLQRDPAFDQGTISLATGTLRGSRVVCSLQGVPVLVRSNRGRGQVTGMLLSPEREPFRSWKNRAWFWAKAAGVPAEHFADADFRQHTGPSTDGIFGAMIDSKQVHKLPVPWLLALLVAYLAIIGPVDQFWLKRINRPMLTWITFPIYVGLFSALIYAIGYKLRAGETEWNELNLVDLLPQGERNDLRGRTFASVYSPANAQYALNSDSPFSALRGEAQWGGGQSANRVQVEQLGAGFRAQINVPVWTSQLYVNDWWQSSAPLLSAQIVPQGTGFRITVHNYMARKLTWARLVLNRRIFELGELPAQQVKTFDLNSSQSVWLQDFVKQNGMGFQQAIQERRRAFGSESSARSWNLPLSAMAASFVSQLESAGRNFGGFYPGNFSAPAGLDLWSLTERGEAVLLAWDAGHSIAKPIPQFNPRRGQRDTLLRLAVPVESEMRP